MSIYKQDLKQEVRFRFGKNWQNFLSAFNDERVVEAEKSLKQMLEIEDLQGKFFLDIGSGSGLFSLAARQLGAKVHSFDYDPDSVSCTLELKHRYFLNDAIWNVDQGSVLDIDYLKSLGEFDVVYAWGVLHHTGSMWQALENASIPVIKGGKLFIAIYNDQGAQSKLWRRVKQLYCSGVTGKTLVLSFFIPYFILTGAIVDVLRGQNPVTRYVEYKRLRGMSIVYDWFDWLGGYPFEVAKPEEIFKFYRERGFLLEKMTTCGGKLGNNQFIFKKQ